MGIMKLKKVGWNAESVHDRHVTSDDCFVPKLFRAMRPPSLIQALPYDRPGQNIEDTLSCIVRLANCGQGVMFAQHDALHAFRAGAPSFHRPHCSTAIRSQGNFNDRKPMAAPSMKPLGPSPGATTSTSQPAVAPGVVVQQPIPQQAYVPSYRVSLFGKVIIS
jgi:hypothetical protein